MKKRQLKKLQKIAAQMNIKPSPQEAFDIVAEHLVGMGDEYLCHFINQSSVYPYVSMHDADQNVIFKSTLDMDQIKAKLYQEGRM